MAKLCMQNYVYYDLYLCTARKDFRPCYGKLGMLASLFPSLPFLALTATATQQTATATLSYKFTWFFIYFLFLSDEGPMLETLDHILSVLAVHRPFYISICISTLPTQHTTFILNCRKPWFGGTCFY